MTRARKAGLCIGNNYPGSGNDLNGCVNDANDWAVTLTGRGYDVQVFQEATRATMLGQLTAHVGALRYGDQLVVTYSGHGTWVPDTDGDEADGRDEAIVPADFRQAGVITDDQLFTIWQGVPYGARVVMVSDSCYSGTISRAIGRPDNPRAAHPARTRFLPPQTFLQDDLYARAVKAQDSNRKSPPRSSRVALLSGCAEYEVSYDATIDGRPRGAASWALLSTLQGAPTLNTWWKATRKLLPSVDYPQAPNLDATPWQRYTWHL